MHTFLKDMNMNMNITIGGTSGDDSGVRHWLRLYVRPRPGTVKILKHSYLLKFVGEGENALHDLLVVIF